jgi:hypothetical protein
MSVNHTLRQGREKRRNDLVYLAKNGIPGKRLSRPGGWRVLSNDSERLDILIDKNGLG